ncbi:striatin-3-like isoform X1 [Biomphalaria glabrata]|uniref:Striatin-3-like isoform X1 n=1 Tax=Biomphalaria glabrata TaxID=6526 RepID=A0A1C7D007_BIOGL|nr:striatin-3-like isoform X1 [Biomphalaria glabrata]KAI8746813.1 striatin-3-like isoform X1 [Biomphalaria glabrata]KAI8788504.1 striatin-3 isoform X1 [Biomphalaria glabrata]
MIEDSLGSQHSGQLGPGSGALGMVTKSQQDDGIKQRPQYSMPGILHFLQTEWARFEMERSQWEVERAELQARIAFLQGERKGQENLKQDLVRRIKMLEYALKQERAKYHKLKYGTDLNPEDLKPPSFDKENKEDQIDGEISLSTSSGTSNATWRQGRQLLRQYLQEIGYTDTIIDVRSARVRSLLGLQTQTGDSDADISQSVLVNGENQANKRDNQGKRAGLKKLSNMATDSALIDAENAVMTTFDFLNSGNVVEDDDDLSDENEDGMAADDEAEERLERKGIKLKNESNEGLDDTDPDTVEALAEFHFLETEIGGVSEKHDTSSTEDEEWVVDQRHISELKEQYKKERKGKKTRPTRHALQAMLASLGSNDDISVDNTHMQSGEDRDDDVPSGGQISYARKPMMGMQDDEENIDGGLGLGELAGLTVNNEADPMNYDISAPKEVYRKTWNAKYTLRSHFDGVRALAFHPVEPVLLTASEDHTLKLWNLQKTVPAKKAASLDVEPVYTFRAHVGPVLSLAVSPSGEQCYSGGMDTTIRCWNIPKSDIDPYDSFDPNVLSDTLEAHTDAVWGLSIHSSKNQLLSCSADGTVRLWSPGNKSPLLNTFTVESEEGVPTSVDFVRCDPSQMVASYTSSNTYIFDIETGKQVLMLETKINSDSSGSNQINRVINHPTLPISITAHEDRHIRFFDNNTGKLIHSMVAHLDSVTSLAIDPNGLYLLSGSHDCSIRLWNLDSKTCVQEITSHRKKFEESIHDVAFHPQKPYIASAGADALAKVFV